jgi:hypothetical protein
MLFDGLGFRLVSLVLGFHVEFYVLILMLALISYFFKLAFSGYEDTASFWGND